MRMAGHDETENARSTELTGNRRPSVPDSDPPMPARTLKWNPPPATVLYTDEAGTLWMRVVVTVIVALTTLGYFAADWLPRWVPWVLFVVAWSLPDRALGHLLPHRGLKAVRPDQGDSLTHATSVRGEGERAVRASTREAGGERSTVRLPFRIISGMVALLFMLLAMFADGDVTLLERIVSFAGGITFGGIALLPGGDLSRLIRASPPAGGFPRSRETGEGAGVRVTDLRNLRSGLKIDG